MLCLVFQQIDTTHHVSELNNVARTATGCAFLTVKLIAVVTMRPVTGLISEMFMQAWSKI